jgi:hypothetical protein
MNSLPPKGHLYPIDPLTLYPEIKNQFHKFFFFALTIALVSLALTMMVAPPDKMKVNTKCHIVVHKLTGIQLKHVFEIKGAINQDMCEYMYSEEKHTHPI